MLTYDSWGGWYDHVPPPAVDRYGYGFRVPALLVSPYAKHGAIDHADARFHLDPPVHRGQLAARAPGDARRACQQHRLGVRFRKASAAARIRLDESRPAAVARVHTGVVFWAYGAAALLACALIALAFARSRRGVAHQPPSPSLEFADFAGTRGADWERLPGEPDAAWHAFEKYRDMGPGTRSQRALGALLNLDDSAAAPRSSDIRRWSVQWHWVARSRAFDAGHHLEVAR